MPNLEEYTRLYTKKGSIGNARAGVIHFLTFVYGDQPGVKEGTTKKAQLEAYNQLSETYLQDTTRDRLTDAMKFSASMSGDIPHSAKNRLASLRGFFSFNGIEFTDRQWKQASLKLPKGKGARTRELEIDTVTIRSVLEHADIRMKALVTFLCSTGCRIGETLCLQMEDVVFDGDGIGTVNIPGACTKTGQNRTCYCSSEAVKYLKEWLRIRESYMRSAANKGNGLGVSRPDIETDNRIFPFDAHSVNVSWNNLTVKAGLGSIDRTTNRRQFHVHMFRKFFRTQLAMKCSVDVVEFLMGHEGYLAGSYVRLTKTQIKESYVKGSSVLHIFGDADVSEIREELETTVKTLTETRTNQEKSSMALSSIVLENTELRGQLAEMRDQIAQTQAQNRAELAVMQEQLNEISKLLSSLNSERRDLLTAQGRRDEDIAIDEGKKIAKTLLKK